MSRDFDTVPAAIAVAELADRIGRHDPSATNHQGVFVMGKDGRASSRAILAVPSIMSARLRRLEEEYVRDPGWMRRRQAS